jgi:hypothetical protein
VFHIQTEDSGIRHPHIITHLFADGGRILKSIKTSYAEHVGDDRMGEVVRGMMQEQHKSMFIALRDGQFDQLLEDPAKKAAAQKAAAAASEAEPARREMAIAATEPPPPSMPEPLLARAGSLDLSTQPPQSARNPVIPAPASVPSIPSLTSPSSAPSSSRRPSVDPTAPTISIPASPLARTASRPASPPPPPIAGPASAASIESDTGIDLDLDALERAAAEAQTPFYPHMQELPPPPAAVLGRSPSKAGPVTGSYSAVTPAHGSPKVPPVAPVAPGPGTGRYAPSRPAAIFATTPPSQGASIFGEELISEKSLDEVILSYLAEDLDGSETKK